jgi:hypothetical protein
MVLRKIRQIVNEALGSLDGEFSKLYASGGRPLIARERLLSTIIPRRPRLAFAIRR